MTIYPHENFTLTKPLLTGYGNCIQGRYQIQNPKKYIGDPSECIFRSSWERMAMVWFDSNSSVLKWGSEVFPIPYLYRVDGKVHRYYVDFMIQVKDRQGSIKNFLVEIKPYSQTIPPKNPRSKKSERYIKEVFEYERNRNKWDAASQWAKTHGFSFIILTENELGVKK